MANSLRFELHKRAMPNADKRTKRHKAAIPSTSASQFAVIRQESVSAMPFNAAVAMRHNRYKVR